MIQLKHCPSGKNNQNIFSVSKSISLTKHLFSQSVPKVLAQNHFSEVINQEIQQKGVMENVIYKIPILFQSYTRASKCSVDKFLE